MSEIKKMQPLNIYIENVNESACRSEMIVEHYIKKFVRKCWLNSPSFTIDEDAVLIAAEYNGGINLMIRIVSHRDAQAIRETHGDMVIELGSFHEYVRQS